MFHVCSCCEGFKAQFVAAMISWTAVAYLKAAVNCIFGLM